MISTAVVSPCGEYRYRLGRRFADGPVLLFVMLNPSRADANYNDPTIRKCMGFARHNGFGAIDVVNLYAYRTHDPRRLRRAGFPVGPENDAHIVEAARQAAKVCVAWGAEAKGLERPGVVLRMLRDLVPEISCIGVTPTGHPRHPVMWRYGPLEPFTRGAVQ